MQLQKARWLKSTLGMQSGGINGKIAVRDGKRADLVDTMAGCDTIYPPLERNFNFTTPVITEYAYLLLSGETAPERCILGPVDHMGQQPRILCR